MPRELPSFDLVVATVGRVAELEHLLGSLDRQTHRRFRIVLVDQNEDDRVEPVVAAHPALGVVRLHSMRGLSRARNVALVQLTAEIVAFPDDDCAYADDLLERVGRRLAEKTDLDGLSGRSLGRDGRSSSSWERHAAVLTDENLWNRVNAGAIFLRRDIVSRVGAFDERLGLGSNEPWSSGEEIDYLIRAIRAGARVEYDPSLVVRHDVRVDDTRVGLRDGASVGYLLRKHRYPVRMVARMLVRPVGGLVVSLARLDRSRASYYAATVRGRITGYRGFRRKPT